VLQSKKLPVVHDDAHQHDAEQHDAEIAAGMPLARQVSSMLQSKKLPVVHDDDAEIAAGRLLARQKFSEESVQSAAGAAMIVLLDSEINVDLLYDALPPALLCKVCSWPRACKLATRCQ
jgi:hypothetical protein